MGAADIIVPEYLTFIGDAVQPGHHKLFCTEHEALSVVHQLMRPRGQSLGCQVPVIAYGATDPACSMTESSTILHQFGWCPKAPPVRVAG